MAVAKAAWLGAAMATAIGCGEPAVPPECAPGEAGSQAAGAAPPRTARSAEVVPPALQATRGEATPKIQVTVANANDERVIALDAAQGSLDEPLVLIGA